MTRIKPGVTAKARHKKILNLAKGQVQGRRRLFRMANESVMKALSYAYRDRRARKRDMRRLWIARINAAARQHGVSYSRFIAMLNENGVDLNRKMLADLAVRDSSAFAALITTDQLALAH